MTKQAPDPLTAGDEMRTRCPVAYSDRLGWSLFRHADVARVLHDPETFSSAVSRHVAVPNGMDPPQHTDYRRALEPPFAEARMAAFEPACRQLAVQVLRAWQTAGGGDFMAMVAQPYAAMAQCAFLGWPASMHSMLLAWVTQSHAATANGDRAAQTRLAAELHGQIVGLLAVRRRGSGTSDATDDLLQAWVSGRPLTDEELVSILRNWTVGEVGTIAAAVGIVAGFLAADVDLQRQLRGALDLVPEAVEEILRLHGPLVSNRRVTTRPVEIGGQEIPAGAPLSLMWPAANRDGDVFADPTVFRLGRDPAPNLLYGAGIHVCPGAPLARLELRVLTEELLGRTRAIEPGPQGSAIAAAWPAAGWESLVLHPR